MRRLFVAAVAWLGLAVGALAAQATYTMPTSGPLTMASFAATLNSALGAVLSNNSGSAAPTAGAQPTQYQFWLNTTSNPHPLSIYDGASWVSLGSVDTSAHTWSPSISATPTGAGVSIPSVASTLVLRDANKNIFSDNLIEGFTTTATAAGTTTLTSNSTYWQFFTGSSNQTVVMPVTSTLALGLEYGIVNNSTGTITVNSSGGNLIMAIGPAVWGRAQVILTSGTTAASWSIIYDGTNAASGKVLQVNNTLTLAGTDGTTMTFPSTSGSVVTLAATQTLTNKTLTSPILNTATTTSPTINGTATGTGVTTAGAASALLATDANANTVAGSFNPKFTTTATAAGTTTLTVASTQVQAFTGVTTQTVQMPAVSTLTTGSYWTIINNSTGALTVNSSGGNIILSIASGNTGIITCVSTSGTTAASWLTSYISSGAGTGTVTNVATGTGLSGGPITTTGTVSFSQSTVGTWAGTPSSANLRAALTDESGTGAALFAGGAIGAATATSLDFGGGPISSYTPKTSWTPTLQFGGANVGITYTTDTGTEAQLGDIWVVSINIALSSKGSSVGTATISNMPHASAITSQACSFGAGQGNYASLTGPLVADINSTTLRLDQVTTTATFALTALADTNFTNTTSLRVTCVYVGS